MALIQCPECTKEISSEALSCPHCGYPVKGPLNEERNIGGLTNQSRLINLSSSDNQRVLLLLKQNKTIRAIKLYKDITGCTLKEAKDSIDGLAKDSNDNSSPFKKTGGGNKSFGKILGFIVLVILGFWVLKWFGIAIF